MVSSGLNVIFLGYSVRVFFRRVHYYFYLKFTKHCFFRFGNIRFTYDRYIQTDKFCSELSLKASNLYELLIMHQTKESRDNRSESVEQILNNRLEIFNYCLFSKVIDWKVDPVSGYRWDNKAWYRDGKKNLPIGSDIKRPWELSRMYFLLPVAIEYFSSKDERLADYVLDCIENWSESNLLGTAPNWSCTMEVAIRCTNIVLALVLISSSDNFRLRAPRLTAIINDHIGFIFKNLENISKITSNHYAANIAGLYVSLKYLPTTNSGLKVLDFARTELEEEIVKQTLPDGWNFELSSCYHRLVFEFFFYSYLVSSPSEFSKKFKEILYLQCNVLNALIKPNGHLVQLGDNDSGRFIVPFGLQNLGSTWMIDSIEFFNKHLSFISDSSRFQVFDQAGVYVAKRLNFFFIIKGGQKGQSKLGGHSHNDSFCFELNFNGKDVVVDPGTGTYTSDSLVRNIFRSNAVHNGIFWEGVEESSFSNGLFMLVQENETTESFSIHKDKFMFTGRNEYKGRWHERTVSVDTSEFTVEIVDQVSSSGAILNFTVPENVNSLSNNSFERGGCTFQWEGNGAVSIKSGLYSPKYGILVNGNHVRVPLVDNKISTVISINDRFLN